MKYFIQYILNSVLILILFIGNVNQFLGNDNFIDIENIEYEKDSNEEKKDEKEWKNLSSIHLSQHSKLHVKKDVSICFYIDEHHSNPIHSIITPPPDYSIE